MRPLHRLYLLFLAIFGSAILYVLITLIAFRTGDNPLFGTRYRRFSETFTESSGDVRHNIDPKKSDELYFFVAMNPPGLTDRNSFPTFTITDFGFDELNSPFKGNADTLCIDHFYLNPIANYDNKSDNLNPLPYCQPIEHDELGYNMLTVPLTATLPMTYTYTSESFWYPYDRIDISLSIRAQFRLLNKGKVVYEAEALPDIVVTGNSLNKDWETSFSVREVTDPIGEWVDTDNVLVIHLARPLIYRVVFILISVVLLLFMIFLCIAESDVFLEGAIGLFLGVIGIKSLIVPPEIGIRTYVDTLLLGIYVLFLIPLGIHLYKYIVKHRQPKQITDEQLLQLLLSKSKF